ALAVSGRAIDEFAADADRAALNDGRRRASRARREGLSRGGAGRRGGHPPPTPQRGGRGKEGPAPSPTAEIAATSDAENSEGYYREALALAEPRGMRQLVAHCHSGLGKLRRDREQADKHLTTAMAMYREMGMTYWPEPGGRGAAPAGLG